MPPSRLATCQSRTPSSSYVVYRCLLGHSRRRLTPESSALVSMTRDSPSYPADRHHSAGQRQNGVLDAPTPGPPGGPGRGRGDRFDEERQLVAQTVAPDGTPTLLGGRDVTDRLRRALP